MTNVQTENFAALDRAIASVGDVSALEIRRLYHYIIMQCAGQMSIVGFTLALEQAVERFRRPL